MLQLNVDDAKKYNAFYAKDTPFAAYSRLHQSKWRESKSYGSGKLGNYLDEKGITNKANYLTDRIASIVSEYLEKAPSTRSMIQAPRIWDNLLSSQPLSFNLFGELSHNLTLATNLFKSLFPERIDQVTAIKFEHSAGRGNNNYTGDHSAFDVFIEYTHNNKKGFIGIEVKYVECLKEEDSNKANKTYERHKARYDKLSEGILKPGSIDVVKNPPLSQIWRDHLLSLAHLKDYEEGFFVFLYPKLNQDCQKGVDEYKKHLKSKDESKNGFYPRFLEDFIYKLQELEKSKWVKDLSERYLTNNKSLKNIKNAHQLNSLLSANLISKQLHFRGSIDSLSLISLSSKSPELGVKWKHKDPSNAEANLKATYQELRGKTPGRLTPEKQLQAWIINYAMNNGSMPFDENIKFITSELAIYNSEKKKIVTDILGYNIKTKELLIIELKSERALKRLIEQVNNFEKVIHENPLFFFELLELHGFSYTGKIKKLVIWPSGQSNQPETTLKSLGVEEVTYDPNSKLSQTAFTKHYK